MASDFIRSLRVMSLRILLLAVCSSAFHISNAHAGFRIIKSTGTVLELAYDAGNGTGNTSAVFAVPPDGEYEVTARNTVPHASPWSSEATGVYRGYQLASIIVDSTMASAVFTVSFPAYTPAGFSKTGRSGLAGIALNADAAAGWQAVRTPISLAKTVAVPPYKLVLTVPSDGIYRVYGRDLEKAGTVLADLNSSLRSMKLYNRGQEVPVLIYGESDGTLDSDDYFEFYGQRNRHTGSTTTDRYYDEYTSRNAYLLAWGGSGSGARMVEENGSIVQLNRDSLKISNRYRYTMHIEQDKLFNRLGQKSGTGERDHWFWKLVPANTKVEVAFDLPEPADGYELEMDMAVMLCGNYPAPGVDNIASIWLNDIRAGNDAVWPAQRWHRAENTFNNLVFGQTLREKDNILEIGYQAPYTDASTSIMLNWIEVTYWRKYRADDDYIEFNRRQDMSDGLYEFSLDGFSSPDIRIYKLGKSMITYPAISLVEGKGGKGYRAVFQDHLTDNSVRYAALTASQIRQPESIRPYTAVNGSVEAEYVIITHKDFKEAADDLAAYRSGRYSTAVITLDALYDNFNYGIASPLALKAFLRDAYRTWNTAPEYVVLMGDGTWDHGRSGADGKEFVPVYLEYSADWGVTASDNWYACVDGDDPVPDLHIGRLPAANRYEAGWMVDKIKAYEAAGATAGTWGKDLLFIAGIGDPYKEFEPDDLYRSQVEGLIRNHVPAEYDVSRVYVYHDPDLAYDPYFGTTADLVSEFNTGCALATFVGHGGGMVWSDNGLFTINDVYSLDNAATLPVVLSATCFTGAFDDPRMTGLGETMVKRRKNGAVAFWGASGLGYTYEDVPYLEALYGSILEDTVYTLGDAVSAAKAKYYSSIGKSSRDSTGAGWALVVQYNLLGDPALKLPLPVRSIAVTPNVLAVRQGDTVRCDVQLPAADDCSIDWSFERHDTVLTQGTAEISGGTGRIAIPVDAGLTGGPADIAVYRPAAGNSRAATGRSSVAIGKAYGVRSARTPANVTFYDSVYVTAVLDGLDSLSDVSCVWYRLGDTLRNSIPMAPVSGNEYAVTRKISPQNCDSVIVYYVRYADGGGADSLPGDSYHVMVRPDIAVAPIVFNGTGRVTADIAVTNGNYRTGTDRTRAAVMTARNIDVSLHVNGTAATTVRIDSLRYAVTETVRLTYPDPAYGDTIFITALPDTMTGEDNDNSANNSSSSIFKSSLFNIVPGGSTTVFSPESLFYCGFPAGTVDSATVVALRSALLPLEDQPAFTYLQPAVPNDAAAFEMTVGTDETALNDAVTVGFNLAHVVSVPENPGIFRWDGVAANWIKMDAVQSATLITARTRKSGWFGLLNDADTDLPVIEVNVEGQRFTGGSYVPEEPVLAAVLQDDNGINTDTGMIEVFLDDEPVAADAFSYIRSTSANTVPVTYAPGLLKPGVHEVRFTARDCAGNVNAVSRTFSIESELKILSPGTYPSPFSDRTDFAFVVTHPTADLSIDIYTASGRLIRTFDEEYHYNRSATQVGLFIVGWDGRDDKGREVANGVYYYRIKARSQGEDVTYRGKVARYRSE